MICGDTTFLVDLWVSAWAVQIGAPLATRNTKPFRDIPGLELIDYPET